MTKQQSNSNSILVKGARMHNLKNIDVDFPRNQLTVVTGVSGSGKSTLVFDTLFAEGQRRYVESLSAYARQFLGKMNKPEVDYIKGISPAIAIEQKVSVRNPRSTVATSTEIYDYLKLLFTKIGKTFSPISNKEVKKDSIDDVVKFILTQEEGATVFVLAKLKDIKDPAKTLQVLLQKGFIRIYEDEGIIKIEDLLNEGFKKTRFKEITLLVDRVSLDFGDDELYSRLADSIQTAFLEADHTCTILIKKEDQNLIHEFSNRFERDGISFEEPSVNFFSFNNPYGACKHCEGFGQVLGIDEDLVIPDKSLSVFDDAIAAWRGETMQEWKHDFIKKSIHFDFPIHRSYYDLNKKEKELLWNGAKGMYGLNYFFKYLEEKTYKIQYRVMLSKYRGKTTCPECNGTRLRKDASYVKIVNKAAKNNLSLSDILLMQVNEALNYFESLKLSENDQIIGDRMLKEIKNRLHFLNEVGLGYLTLNRLSNTLSGGESQRINLATSLGSSLVGSMYILDEPSIGLHSKDTDNLIKVLKRLRDLGNTVIVVEHDQEIMEAADHIIDIGPLAGSLGGDKIFEGSYKQILKDSESLTGKYLSDRIEIEIPKFRRKWNDFISIKGAKENNLKNIDVDFPLHTLCVVTGMSGSGKTTLIKQILYPALQKRLGNYTGGKTGSFDKLEGSIDRIGSVEFIDQNPIGKSTRSNPVTYIKAYDAIRDLFSSQVLATSRGYKPQHFSFNVDGGRCEVCQGEGEVVVEMQFMADLHLPCESCKGKRFKDEILEVEFKSKNISDVLNMTIDEAMEFFRDQKSVLQKLKPLQDVGLGYVQLGQSSSTLSGGEAQRIKLASFLAKSSYSEKILFIFDEPTTGLHFHDISKLMNSFNALIDMGHSIIIIEHNLDVIKCADWIIDLGPQGGDKGGELVFAGTPEDLIKNKKSITGEFLKSKFKRKN